MVRARLIRFRMPPESCEGILFKDSVNPTFSKTSLTFSEISFSERIFVPSFVPLVDVVENLAMSAGTSGDAVVSRRGEPTSASIASRVSEVIQYHWSGNGAPTATQRQNLKWAGEAFTSVRASLEQLVERDLRTLETAAEAASAPWTAGRVPKWP